MLNNKNILYIGVKFYHYHTEIINKLKNDYGASVSFFPERDTSLKFGIINRISPSYIEKYQELYYKKLLKKIINLKFDYFLVIRGFKMPLWFVKEIKETNPGIKTIYYQWDSNNNSPFINIEEKYNIINEFEAKLSFDYEDVINNPILKYCPTFYTDEIKKISLKKDINLKYDLFYFGSYLPERYAGLLNFIEFAKANNHTLKVHFYMPYRYYLIERLKGTKIDRKLISTKPMDRNRYLQLLEVSKCIVDVSNANQTGMAMRVIDAFGADKKLVTTNAWILKDEAYDPSQVLFIDIDNISIPDSFFESPIVNQTKQDFSLDNWIKNIFIRSLS